MPLHPHRITAKGNRMGRVPMQTDNEDEHRRSRAGTGRQTSHRRARRAAPPGDVVPATWPCPEASGSPTQTSSERPHASQPCPPFGLKWAAVSQRVRSLLSPLLPTQNVLRGFRTTRPQRFASSMPGQTHVGNCARRQQPGTQTQHAGTASSGPGQSPASSELQGSQREEGYGPGRQQRTGLWGRRRGRRLVAGHFPRLPPAGLLLLEMAVLTWRNSVWPAWW